MAEKSKSKFVTFDHEFQGKDAASIQKSFALHLKYSLAKDQFTATERDMYDSLAMSVRDRLIERWIETQQAYYAADAKRVYYLSLEFLIGRTLGNSMLNLALEEPTADALRELGYSLEELREEEWDAGLGNGGLGRLAACFLDSMATLQLPAYGYGIRYEYGIFCQRIVDGQQVEMPDTWLRYGNCWEFPRAENLYPISFHGRVKQYFDAQGVFRNEWVDTERVMAMAYDTPVPGYHNSTVNHIRLWSAKSSREFNFEYFNHGDYIRAIADKAQTENISRVLYPNDNNFEGKELRLKQEYFFVAATIKDIIRRYKKTHTGFDAFADKVAIQLNDTHPAIAVAELMRWLVDHEGLGWEPAWEATTRVFGYTNHTVLPEALEKWSVSLIEHVLPRHMQIIYEINRRFLEEVRLKYDDDGGKMQRMSIIEDGQDPKVRMAHLAIVGSHAVNGVAALHTQILKNELFRDFYELWPEKFSNKTNGITQRRWLALCNPGLSALITKKIGGGWVTDLHRLRELTAFADDEEFQQSWREIKRQNKLALAACISSQVGLEVNAESLFDCHTKRMHEYKRQLLNVLHVVTLYNRIRRNPERSWVPRTVLFAGKSAPGYTMAKLIIRLIHGVADVVNRDPMIGDRLKVVFIPNYSVSLAERIVPAADLSEQISTAGTEASGTGNMKFALNGALTIGTLDGANIEILEEVGVDNIFIFGLKADEVTDLKRRGYNPIHNYQQNDELRLALDQIRDGHFSPGNRELYLPIIDSLLYLGDRYLLLSDYAAYVRTQERVSATYLNPAQWTRMAIFNVARMGKFSTDRTIQQYADEIWQVKPVNPGKAPDPKSP